jgi:hypothetical protein
MVLWGFWLAWRHRSRGTPSPGRRFALAAALALLALPTLLAAAAYPLFFPGTTTRATIVPAALAVVFLLVLGLVVHRLRRADDLYRRVWRYAAITTATAVLAAVYATALHGRFVDFRTELREATLDDGAVRDLADLTRLLRYTPRNRQVLGMRWSPDGESLLMTVGGFRTGAMAQADIWKLAADGSGATNLTARVRGNHGQADFSSDGRHIVFRSGRTGTFQLYLMDANGGNVRRLTDGPAKKNFPALSPRGDEIVFASDEDGTLYGPERSFEIYTLRIEPDGSAGSVRRITNHPGQSAHPRYSPDGEWIVYTSGKGGINDEEPLVQAVIFAAQMYGEIYAYRLRDGLSVRLTHDKWENGVPFWIERSAR